jgi:TPR repeat protein
MPRASKGLSFPLQVNRQLTRAWLLLAALVFPIGAWAGLQQLRVPALWRGMSAALAAVAPLIVAEINDRRKLNDEQRQGLVEHIRAWSPSRGDRLVRDVENPVELGVKPAAIGMDLAHPQVPPYVERRQDKQLRSALENHSFVLIVGDSTAGKSRSAFEVARQVLPDRRLIVPAKKDSLVELLRLGVGLQETVIWLDDLDTYLGPDGLTADILDRLLAAGNGSVTVLATMRAAAHDQYASKGDVSKPERKVLDRALHVRLRQRLEAEERTRVRQQFADARLDEALNRFGLGEYLAAGPELVDRFENASSTNPLGRAVVRAVVDWRRVGVSRPIPEDMISKLYPAYLEPPDATHTRDELELALQWATERIYGTSALLARHLNGYLAFDYLLDYVEREREDEIPRSTWELVVAAIDCTEALDVGIVAYGKQLWSVAEEALRKAITSANEDVKMTGSWNLGAILENRGMLEEAGQRYREALAAGHPRAANSLGAILHRQGELRKAEQLYRQAAEAGDATAAYNLAQLDRRESERWLSQAASAGHADAAFDLATNLERRGEARAIERLYRQAVKAGHPGAANSLGAILERRGELQEAERLYRQAAEGGNASAAYNLARLEADQHVLQERERLLLTAASVGDPDSLSDLATSRTERERLQSAERWYRRAAEAGNADAASELANILLSRGQEDAAEHWFRQAADKGSSDAAYQLGVLLLARGERLEAERLWRMAAAQGHSRAAFYLHFLAKQSKKASRSRAGESRRGKS